MRIVLATPLILPEIGGPAIYTKELTKRLSSLHTITVVAYASTSEKMPGVRLVTVSKNRPLPFRIVKYFLVLLKEAKGADVIYVQNAVASGLPAVLVGMIRRIPVVLKFVGDEAWERASQRKETKKLLEEFLAHPEGSLYVRLLMGLQGFVLRHADIVTTPSAYLLEAIVRTYHLKPERAVVNYNAAEETETAPFTPKRNPYQIAMTARLVAWKGIDGVIRAVALLVDQFPDIALVVAGDGPEEESYKALAHELGVEKHVTFLGRVTRAETWHLRKNSAIYVLNSTYEGLPHTALTSFAAKIPMIATNIPGTNEAVYHEQSGLLVEPGDTEALAAAIARLLADEALQEKLVAGATALLEEKFSWDAHVRTLLNFFDLVVKK